MRFVPILAALLAALLTAAPAAAELPAPELTASFPANQEEIAAPLDAITLIFAAEADLVEVVVTTPDQRRLVLHDAFGGSEERRDTIFVLPLPEAVSLPGVYLIEISASVSDPSDSSASALSATSSFIITEPAAPEDPAPPASR